MIIIINSNSTKNDRQRRGVGPSRYRLDLLIHLTCVLFDLIECFTTTFLRTHSWLNWVDEDDDEYEIGLKEKPEDTRYIKKITSK